MNQSLGQPRGCPGPGLRLPVSDPTRRDAERPKSAFDFGPGPSPCKSDEGTIVSGAAFVPFLLPPAPTPRSWSRAPSL